MIFHDVTVTAAGDVRSRRRHDSARLVRGAVDIFSDMLRAGLPLDAAIPVAPFAHIRVAVTGEAGAALALFSSRGVPLTVSALLAGEDPAAEERVLRALQEVVLRVCRGTPTEPGFGLLALTERPLLATVPLPVPPQFLPDMEVVADMESCLMAAWAEAHAG